MNEPDDTELGYLDDLDDEPAGHGDHEGENGSGSSAAAALRIPAKQLGAAAQKALDEAIAAAAARVVEERLSDDTSWYDAIEEAVATALQERAVAATEQDPNDPEPVFPNVAEWVEQYLLPNYRRGRGFRWCDTWWEHAEAVTRLEAIWQAWEALRLEGATGLANWWRDYADHHVAILTDPDRGPFFGCNADRDGHQVQEQFASKPPPPNLFRPRGYPEDDQG